MIVFIQLFNNDHDYGVSKCAGYDGVIASAPSLDIQEYLFIKGGNTSLNLGAKDTGGRLYIWEDGTPWDWTNWRNGQPNPLYPEKLCVFLNSWGKWSIIHCDTTSYHNYFCQVRAAMMRERWYFSEKDLDRLY